jgi:hypothetical protein
MTLPPLRAVWLLDRPYCLEVSFGPKDTLVETLFDVVEELAFVFGVLHPVTWAEILTLIESEVPRPFPTKVVIPVARTVPPPPSASGRIPLHIIARISF